MSGYRQERDVGLVVSASALRGVPVEEACQLVDGLVVRIMEAYPDLGVVEQYRRIAASLPERVDMQLQYRLLDIAQRENNEHATFTFLMLNLMSVFTEAKRYFNDDSERNDELVCAGILELLQRLPDINGSEQLKIQVHHAINEGIVAFLKQNEGVNPGLTRFGVARDMQKEANDFLKARPWGAGESKLKDLAQDLVSRKSYPERGPGPRTVYDYLVKRVQEGSNVPGGSTDVEEEVYGILRSAEVNRQMALLPEIERQTLEMYFWEDMTLEQIGNELGYSIDGVRGVMKHALRTLRHPSISRLLR